MEGQVEKISEKLGRSALYKSKCTRNPHRNLRSRDGSDRLLVVAETDKVTKLPYYLTVQMMRFEWNPASYVHAAIPTIT